MFELCHGEMREINKRPGLAHFFKKNTLPYLLIRFKRVGGEINMFLPDWSLIISAEEKEKVSNQVWLEDKREVTTSRGRAGKERHPLKVYVVHKHFGPW